MNANSAKSGTGSVSGPTATTSVTTAVKPKTVTINENETVQVSAAWEDNYLFEDPDPVNDSAFKCGGCNLLTIHQGYGLVGLPSDHSQDPVTKRIYMCTNCGKFVSK